MTRVKVVIRDSVVAVAEYKSIDELFSDIDMECVNVKSLHQNSTIENWKTETLVEPSIVSLLHVYNQDVILCKADDLPYPLQDDLSVFAVVKSGFKGYQLYSKDGADINELASNSKVGVHSPKLRKQLLELRSDLKVFNLSDSSESLVAKVNSGELNAVILNGSDSHYLDVMERCSKIDLQGHPLNGYLCVLGPSERKDLKNRFFIHDERKHWGKVYLAGFGPGNPGLITRRAESLLAIADITYHDDLLDERWLEKFCSNRTYVGKRKGKHSVKQEDINELLYQAALKGKKVVRLKGGDPLIFGRGAEEYHYLAERLIEAEIIPGITSAFAAAAEEIIPLTARSVSSSVSFLSGHDLAKLRIPHTDTLVFYMGASKQKELAARLIEEGWSANTPVAIVQNASLSTRKSVRTTIAHLADQESGLVSPSIIIVGHSAAKPTSAESGKWLFTGLNMADFKGSGQVIHTPLIQVEYRKTDDEIKNVLKNLKGVNRIVFTSRYSVNAFLDQLLYHGYDLRNLSDIEISSIGTVTSAELLKRGLIVKPLSEEESSEGIISYFKKNKIKGEKIIVPRSAHGLQTLQDGLSELGNEVVRLVVYDVVMPDSIIRQNLDEFYGVVFTSPITFDHFIEFYGELPEHLQVICRGKMTQKRYENYCAN